MKKKPLYTLLSLLIVLALAVPVWSTVVRAATPTPIWDWHDLNDIRNDLSGDYVLMNDLDSTTTGYDELAGPTANGGLGWQPIGTAVDPFAGTFDGQVYEVRDLFVIRPDEDYVGLFGVIQGGGVANIGVVDVNVTGYDYIGGLVGDNFEGSVTNSQSSGTVTGNSFVGGLVGISDGILSTSCSFVSVAGELWVGGLVGSNLGSVNDCYAVGSVSGDWGVGGLVGDNFGGLVMKSYSSGEVTGNRDAGGLVGAEEDGTVNDSFWDTETSGTDQSAGGIGKTTTEMKDIDTFSDAGWHITGVTFGTTDHAFTWNIVGGQTYPFLGWQDPVGAPGALILGQTREVNCATLSGVTVTAYLNDEPVNSTISDIAGNYELTVPEVGEYEVVATKDGFRPQAREITIEDLEEEYDLNFVGNHGLIPNGSLGAGAMDYFLHCMNLYLEDWGECSLAMDRFLAVMNAYLEVW